MPGVRDNTNSKVITAWMCVLENYMPTLGRFCIVPNLAGDPLYMFLELKESCDGIARPGHSSGDGMLW